MANYKVGDLDVTITGVSQNAVASLDEVINRINAVGRALGLVTGQFGAWGDSVDNAFKNINSGAIRTILTDFEDITETTETATDSQQEFTGAIERGASSAAVGTRELNKLSAAQKEVDKSAKKAAHGGLSKLIERIGRVALYRTIRRGLRMVTSTFTDSIQAYSQVNENINRTMSQLTSSTKVIKLSLGTVIFPIIQAITPAVQSLSVGFANMANAINKSMALAKGETTYTKILTEATEDYADSLNKASGALFDFDKFRALSSKNDSASASSYLIQETVSELTEAEKKYSSIYYMLDSVGGLLGSALDTIEKIGNSATFQTIMDVVGFTVGGLASASSWLLEILNTSGLLEPILGGIAGYLTYIGATKLFTALSAGSLVKWLGAVVSLLKEDFSGTLKMLGTDLLNVMSSTKALAVGIGALSMSIMYFVQNFDELGSTAKWVVPLIAAVTATAIGLTTALVAFYSAHLGLGAAIKAGLTAAAVSGAVALAVSTSVAKSMPKYAMGASDIDGGSIFVAGEAGKTEMVYTGDNGKTNVANVQQMAQAMYSGCLAALKDYGVSRGEMPQLQPASDTGIYQAAERGARKVGKTFNNV